MTRIGLAALLVALATLLVPVGVASTWLSLRVDDTDKYVETVAPLADDDELRDRLADELATAAVGTLQDLVPLNLPDALDTMVRASTKEVVESPGFPDFWRDANRDTHQEFLAIVHEDAGFVDEDGFVVVDLGPLLHEVLVQAAEDLGIPASLLPADTPLPLPVMRESDLEKARGGYQVLDWLSLWVPVIWVALVGIAIAVSPGWRGRARAAAAAALGAALGGAAVLLLTEPTTDLVVDQVDPAKQDLARLVVEVVVQTLDDTATTVVVAGVVVGVALLCGSFWPRVVSRP